MSNFTLSLVTPACFEARYLISESQLYVNSQQKFTFMGLNELVQELGPRRNAICPLTSSQVFYSMNISYRRKALFVRAR